MAKFKTKSCSGWVLVLALVAATFSLYSPAALATKERGGGNVTADGKLGEIGLAEDSVELSPNELRALLIPTIAKIGGELPGLFEDVLFIDDFSTKWYLNSKLDSRGCEFKSAAEVPTSTAACQSFDSEGVTEIRILKSFWMSAATEQKADLVLHERLRTLIYKRGTFDCENCLFRAVLAFQAPTSATFVLDLQHAMRINKVGTYLLLNERSEVTEFVNRTMTETCSTGPGRSTGQALAGVKTPPTFSLGQMNAANYVFWINAANFEESCRDITAASENTLSYWRGD